MLFHSVYVAKDAFVAEPFFVMAEDKLKKLRENTLNFYNFPKGTSPSQDAIRQKLKEHNLDTDGLTKCLARIEKLTRLS
jgi:hypothetical protein